jgi:hypothetical protein
MNLEEQSTPNENAPRPFREIPGLWIRFWQMTDSFFQNELSRVSVPNTLYGILVYAGLSTLITVVISLLRWIINSITMPSLTQSTEYTTIMGISMVSTCCIGLLMYPLSFYLNNGITYLGALVFGGKGSFNSQAYLSSLFVVPIGLLSSAFTIISLIPTFGAYIYYAITFGMVIVHYIFTIRAVKAVHNFTSGKAIAAVLSPLALLLIPICLIGILMAMGPMIGNVFSTINSSLNTIP